MIFCVIPEIKIFAKQLRSFTL